MGAIGVPSSMTFADLYGPKIPNNGEKAQPTDIEKASGSKVLGAVTKQPASYLIAFIGLLVLVRVLWEKGA